jgi:hypothetical protein
MKSTVVCYAQLFFVMGIVGSAAAANVLYDFSYSGSGPLFNGFDIKLSSPGFITTSGSLGFTPVNITDGTTTWTLTQDHFGAIPPTACFAFGTVNAVLSDCGLNSNPPELAVEFEFYPGGFPTTTGVFPASLFIQSFFTQPGSAKLTITASPVPEPSSWALVVSALSTLAGVRWLRFRRSPLKPTALT